VAYIRHIEHGGKKKMHENKERYEQTLAKDLPSGQMVFAVLPAPWRPRDREVFVGGHELPVGRGVFSATSPHYVDYQDNNGSYRQGKGNRLDTYIAVMKGDDAPVELVDADAPHSRPDDGAGRVEGKELSPGHAEETCNNSVELPQAIEKSGDE
jgi:hypothetical protein